MRLGQLELKIRYNGLRISEIHITAVDRRNEQVPLWIDNRFRFFKITDARVIQADIEPREADRNRPGDHAKEERNQMIEIQGTKSGHNHFPIGGGNRTNLVQRIDTKRRGLGRLR